MKSEYEIMADIEKCIKSALNNTTIKNLEGFTVAEDKSIRYIKEGDRAFVIHAFGSSYKINMDKSKYADYDYINMEIGSFKKRINDEAKALADKYSKRGWCRKLDDVVEKLSNYEAIIPNEELIDSIKEVINLISKEWGAEVVYSEPKEVLVEKPNLNRDYSYRYEVVLGFKKHDLTAEPMENCRDCSYFTMTGVETSHEWVEFFPWCTKLNNSLAEFENEKTKVIHCENCPLKIKKD